MKILAASNGIILVSIFNPTFLPFPNKVFALREMDRERPRGRISGRNSEEFREIYQLIVPPRSDKDSRFPDRIEDARRASIHRKYIHSSSYDTTTRFS